MVTRNIVSVLSECNFHSDETFDTLSEGVRGDDPYIIGHCSKGMAKFKNRADIGSIIENLKVEDKYASVKVIESLLLFKDEISNDLNLLDQLKTASGNLDGKSKQYLSEQFSLSLNVE